jgi:hypothetical protein
MKKPTYKLCDYKGKHFIIQDELDDDDYDAGEIEKSAVMDDGWLRTHVENCLYFGIPAYFGKDKELKDRINKLYEEYDKCGKIKR